jgi:hypothetical protein
VVSRQASRDGVSPAPTLARSLAELLVGLDLLLLHVAAGLPLLLRGESGAAVAVALGTADDSLLGLMAPGQYAATAFLLAARARGGGSASLSRAVAAAGLLAAGDLFSLPARLGGGVASRLGLAACCGLAPAQLGKLVVGGALAALMVALIRPLVRSAEEDVAAVGRILVLAALALAGIDLLLDLPGAWLGVGPAEALLLDPAEELAEALTATFALVGIVRLFVPGSRKVSQIGTDHLLSHADAAWASPRRAGAMK